MQRLQNCFNKPNPEMFPSGLRTLKTVLKIDDEAESEKMKTKCDT